MKTLNNITKIFVCGFSTFILGQEMEVDGILKVTGEIDVSNQRVVNVADPVEPKDAVNLDYLSAMEMTTSGSGLIVVKCPWYTESISSSESVNPGIGSCEPPSCPDGWTEVTTYNEVTGAGGGNAFNNSSWEKYFLGNSCRICEKE